MKTLSKEVTSTFYRDDSGFCRLMAHWSRIMQDRKRRKELTAAHHLLYLILRGKNWRRAFTPPGGVNGPQTDEQCARFQRLLDNGGLFQWGAVRAVSALHSETYEAKLLAPFAEFICKEALSAIRELVPAFTWQENPLEREPYVG